MRLKSLVISGVLGLLHSVASPAAPGDLDPAFNGTGIARYSFGPGEDDTRATAVQADGKIIVAGSCLNGAYNNVFIARYHTDGSLDSSFGTGGKAIVHVGQGSFCTAVRVQTDGKIVAAGSAYNSQLDLDFSVIRLNADGTPDNSFGLLGRVTTAIGTSEDRVTCLRIQSDGKIVVAGYTYAPSFKFDMAIARYTSSGILDTSFDGDGKAVISFGNSYNVANGMVIQSDGKIVLAGSTDLAGPTRVALARCNVDGSLDASFDGDGRLITTIDGTASSAALQSQTPTIPEKIVVAGHPTPSGNIVLVARFNLDGTPDTSFDGDGKVLTPLSGDAQAVSVVVQAVSSTLRKIIVSGWTAAPSSAPMVLAIRYGGAGTLDATFDGDGIATTTIGAGAGYTGGVVLGSAGQIIVATSAYTTTDSDVALVRYNSSGTLDTAFDGDGIRTDNMGLANAAGRCVAVQPDDRIVAAGGSFGGDMIVARYAADGSLDSSFSGDGVAKIYFGFGVVSGNGVALQGDGKIVVAGTRGDGPSSKVAVARLNSDGSLDGTFSQDGIVQLGVEAGWNTIAAVAIQPDGKIVVAGDCDVYDNSHQFTYTTLLLIRFDPDGTLDTSFDGDGVTSPQTSRFSLGRAMALQPDGSIVVAGLSLDSNNRSHALVARYTSGGQLDVTFNTTGVFILGQPVIDVTAHAVQVQPNGSILAAGEGQISVDGDYVILRLNSNGTLDTSFDGDGIVTTSFAALSFDRAHGLTLLSDGRFLATGRTFENQKDVYSAARYLADGSLDASFGTGGKVIIDLGSPSDIARAIAIDSQQRILIMGDSGGLFGLIRLEGDDVSAIGIPDPSIVPFGITRVGPNPFHRAVLVGFSLAADATVLLQVFGPDGRLVATPAEAPFGKGLHRVAWEGKDHRGRPVSAGVYFLRLEAGGRVATQRVVRIR